VGSYFEDLSTRNPFLKSKFNLDARFRIITFLVLKHIRVAGVHPGPYCASYRKQRDPARSGMLGDFVAEAIPRSARCVPFS
jgi:hypothetical protein